jgi:predicted DCC family thiol-disulfide oxidoreductase YuxK
VLVIPNQSAGVLERYGVTREEADRSAWAIAGDGRHTEGADAVNAVLRELGGWTALVSRILGAPMLGAVERRVYRWFARHRTRFSWFGVRPECEEPDSRCY